MLPQFLPTRRFFTTGAGSLPSAVAGQRTAPGVGTSSPARWVDATCRYAWSIGNRLDGRWETGVSFRNFQHRVQPNDSKGRCREWGPKNTGWSLQMSPLQWQPSWNHYIIHYCLLLSLLSSVLLLVLSLLVLLLLLLVLWSIFSLHCWHCDC